MRPILRGFSGDLEQHWLPDQFASASANVYSFAMAPQTTQTKTERETANAIARQHRAYLLRDLANCSKLCMASVSDVLEFKPHRSRESERWVRPAIFTGLGPVCTVGLSCPQGGNILMLFRDLASYSTLLLVWDLFPWPPEMRLEL